MSKPEKEALCVGADGQIYDDAKVGKIIFALHAADQTLGQLRSIDFVTNKVTIGSVKTGDEGKFPLVVNDGVLTYRDRTITLAEWE